jgi:O-6-methylguanine DNA methyltransferase
LSESDVALRPVRRELDLYFAGKLKDFTVPLDLHGTDFQLRCWRGLLEIPYGKTCSYADLAKKVGSPKGFRAVGMANHDNPIPIIVPCHRVITSNRKLGGYGGGLDVKEKLLRLEGAVWREPHPSLAFD